MKSRLTCQHLKIDSLSFRLAPKRYFFEMFPTLPKLFFFLFSGPIRRLKHSLNFLFRKFTFLVTFWWPVKIDLQTPWKIRYKLPYFSRRKMKKKLFCLNVQVGEPQKKFYTKISSKNFFRKKNNFFTLKSTVNFFFRNTLQHFSVRKKHFFGEKIALTF